MHEIHTIHTWLFTLLFHSIESRRCHNNNVHRKKARRLTTKRGNQCRTRLIIPTKNKATNAVKECTAFVAVAGLLMQDCCQGQCLPQPQNRSLHCGQIGTLQYSTWEKGNAIKHAITIGSTTWNSSEDGGNMRFFTPDQPSPMSPLI